MLCCYQKAAASAARAFDPLILRHTEGQADGRRYPSRTRASACLVSSTLTPSASNNLKLSGCGVAWVTSRVRSAVSTGSNPVAPTREGQADEVTAPGWKPGERKPCGCNSCPFCHPPCPVFWKDKPMSDGTCLENRRAPALSVQLALLPPLSRCSAARSALCAGGAAVGGSNPSTSTMLFRVGSVTGASSSPKRAGEGSNPSRPATQRSRPTGRACDC